MRAFGSDRFRAGEGGQLILVCRRSKGWTVRIPKTLTRMERPGTAVLWEERYFEVVLEERSGEAVRYVLEPWRDEHVMRVTDAYDEASEARREAEYRAAVRRHRGRKVANLLGILTGLLPAPVQEQLGSELGLLPARLTTLSLIASFLFEVFAVNTIVRAVMAQEPIPLVWAALAAYVALESWIRVHIVLGQSRPIGTAFGFILYSLFYAVAPGKKHLVPPITIGKAEANFGTAPPPDVALVDAYRVREPLLTLLTPAEQQLLAERFGFNYRKQAFTVAWIILVLSTAGIATSVVSLQEGQRTVSASISLLLAFALAAEQVARLRALQSGPAGSMLGKVVRPLARKLFTP